MTHAVRVLVVEDDVIVRQFLRAALQRENYEVLEALTGENGVAVAAQGRPQVILLDLGLPDMDGIEVVRQLREWMHTPIIVLSSNDQENAKVAALDAGANDYLTKPIGVAELHARIRVALRMSTHAGHTEHAEPHLDIHGLRIDIAQHEVTLHGKTLHLTPIEYKLLVHLVRHAGKVVRHRDLLQAVWGPKYDTEVNYLRIYIKHLRDKIEPDSNKPRFIRNEPGIGYRFLAVAPENQLN